MASGPENALVLTRRGFGLVARLAVAGGVLLLEKSLLNFFVDFSSAQNAEGLGALVRVSQHWVFRFLVSFAIAAALFACLRGGPELREVDATARLQPPVRPPWVLAHLICVVPLVPLSLALYGSTAALPFAAVVALWLLLATLAAAALFAALAPWSLWLQAIRALGDLWWYAGCAAAGAALAMGWSQSLWRLTARVTFEAVYRLLNWLLPALQVDPATLLIDTGRFGIVVAPVCSGLEGMGLMLAFCIALLLLFRREFIFPRALLLIPAGILLSFALNIARIAALVLIGDAGFERIAVYGFHSQAGWIAFNVAAVGIALVGLRSSWFRRASGEGTQPAAVNFTAVYLLPYLGVVLAGMVSHAMSAGLERLYWLRLIAAALAFAYSWPRLIGVDWRFSWRGGLAGLLAFALWLAGTRATMPPETIPPTLLMLGPVSAGPAWIIGHIVTGVLVLPLVEELAFRGYLLRRLNSTDFESIAPGSVGWGPLLVSSAAFGLWQAPFWLPGVLAGAVFGVIYMRTGRLGEALAAHVVANGLAAGVMLAGSQGQLW